MNRSLKFILFIILFTLGITNAGSSWVKNSLNESNDLQADFSGHIESVHASFNTGNPETRQLHFPYYGESEDGSAFDISNAILLQSNASNGLGIPKILKNNSTIRSLHFVEPGASQKHYALNDPDDIVVNASYRYYVYTLRHIII